MTAKSDSSCTRSSEQGLSLIELMIALTVLAVGLAALAGLFSIAVLSNNRAKGDTSATMLAQTVLERIAAEPASSAAAITIQDCALTNWSLATAAGGARLNASGGIDFSETYAAAPGNYKMLFVSCGNGGRQTIYDVRWNVQLYGTHPLPGGGAGPASRLITVSARPQQPDTGNGAPRNAAMFTLPVTLRTVGGL